MNTAGPPPGVRTAGAHAGDAAAHPPAAARSLRPSALYEAIADRVRERILCHELKPGDAIDELDFVNSYGVSRTPVRKALKVLSHEGLLTSVNRRGTVVTVLEPHEREEAWALYRLLRSYAAQQAEQVQPEQPARPRLLQRLLQLVERQLRLAYGPAFDDEMRRVDAAAAAPRAGGKDKACHQASAAPSVP
ncbi:GntR family transcriptional regulator [Pseudorhodoferax sp.]|uniref:GntR family transcriptional regulator n=1 Tax=Pseudorhodoferax sp. TaxID=1993553 RepID=UPI0039E549A0